MDLNGHLLTFGQATYGRLFGKSHLIPIPRQALAGLDEDLCEWYFDTSPERAELTKDQRQRFWEWITSSKPDVKVKKLFDRFLNDRYRSFYSAEEKSAIKSQGIEWDKWVKLGITEQLEKNLRAALNAPIGTTNPDPEFVRYGLDRIEELLSKALNKARDAMRNQSTGGGVSLKTIAEQIKTDEYRKFASDRRKLRKYSEDLLGSPDETPRHNGLPIVTGILEAHHKRSREVDEGIDKQLRIKADTPNLIKDEARMVLEDQESEAYRRACYLTSKELLSARGISGILYKLRVLNVFEGRYESQMMDALAFLLGDPDMKQHDFCVALLRRNGQEPSDKEIRAKESQLSHWKNKIITMIERIYQLLEEKRDGRYYTLEEAIHEAVGVPLRPAPTLRKTKQQND